MWNEVAQFVETPVAHESGPMLRPVTVGIDSGGHYADAVAEFVKAGGPAYQCIKGLGRHRFDGFLARRSVTSDVLDRYGANGLLLIGGNESKASVFSLLRQSIAGAEPRPMVWPKDESRYGVEEFTQIVSETLVRVMDKRTGIDNAGLEEDRPRKRGFGFVVLLPRHRPPPRYSVPAERSRGNPKGCEMGRVTPNQHRLEYGEVRELVPSRGRREVPRLVAAARHHLRRPGHRLHRACLWRSSAGMGGDAAASTSPPMLKITPETGALRCPVPRRPCDGRNRDAGPR